MNISKLSIDAHKLPSSFAMDVVGVFRTTSPYSAFIGDDTIERQTMAWLATSERPPSSESPQSRLLVERIGLFPSSGKIRCVVTDPLSILTHLKNVYISEALDSDESDGLNLTFAEWRFKISPSTTESMILLHVESRGDVELMHAKTEELLNEIGNRNSSERKHTPVPPVLPTHILHKKSNSY